MLAEIYTINNKTVKSDIELFLKEECQSINTRKSYMTDIKQFFKTMRNKSIDELNEYDLKVEYADVLKYRSIIKEKYNSNSTVNRKINSVGSLYKFLKRIKYDVDLSAFKVKHLKETQSKTIGNLKPYESEMIIEESKTLPNGEEKSLCLELLYKTSIRVDAITKLTWNDFVETDDDIVIVNVYDKGEKEDNKPITKEFYNRLLQLKSDSDYVFSFKKITVQRAFDTVIDKLGFDKERNLSVHSLKKSLINWIIDETGDITQGAKQGNHKSINTTYKYYYDKKKDYTNMPGILIEKNNDIEELNELSKDELIELINSCTLRTKNEIISKLNNK